MASASLSEPGDGVIPAANVETEYPAKAKSAAGPTVRQAYHPRLEDRHQVCSMPANAWGSCILAGLMYKHWLSGHCIDGEYFIVGGLQVLGLAVTISAQVLLINFLGEIAGQRHEPTSENFLGECNPRYGHATFICTLLLMGQVMSSELRETITMWKFIDQIPWRKAEDDHHPEMPESSELDQGPLVLVLWKDDQAREERIGTPVTGIYAFHSFVIYLLLIGKAVLAIWLGINSFDFIMYTEDDHEILLNCTATLFICEIDDIVFRVVNPKGFQKLFEEYPSFLAPSLNKKLHDYWHWWLWCRQSCTRTKHPEKQDQRKSMLQETAAQYTWFQAALSGCLSSGWTIVATWLLKDFYCSDFTHSSENPDAFLQRSLRYFLLFVAFLSAWALGTALLIVVVAKAAECVKRDCCVRRSATDKE